MHLCDKNVHMSVFGVGFRRTVMIEKVKNKQSNGIILAFRSGSGAAVHTCCANDKTAWTMLERRYCECVFRNIANKYGIWLRHWPNICLHT